MELTSYFKDFLTDIRLTENQRQDCITGHTTLRARLMGEEYLKEKDVIVTTFLQGSYARNTIVRPKSNETPDVDVVVVTRLSEAQFTPDNAMNVFVPFLDKYYKGKWRKQGRSIGISLSYVNLDMVITSAPTEAQIYQIQEAVRSSEMRAMASSDDANTYFPGSVYQLVEAAHKVPGWAVFPLRIPDRDRGQWEDAHPLAQAEWTVNKNAACNGHYINVVKALKWWRKDQHNGDKPKGYPLEHIIGYCCPDGIKSVPEGVTRALEAVNANWDKSITAVPFLQNHGTRSQNVLSRTSLEDFQKFLGHTEDAGSTSRHALGSDDKCESAQTWGELFGSKFPQPEPEECEDKGNGGFTPRKSVSTVTGSRFA